MTPYREGHNAYSLHREHYEANPYINDPRIAERLAFSTWTNDAQEWYCGWRDAALGLSR